MIFSLVDTYLSNRNDILKTLQNARGYKTSVVESDILYLFNEYSKLLEYLECYGGSVCLYKLSLCLVIAITVLFFGEKLIILSR